MFYHSFLRNEILNHHAAWCQPAIRASRPSTPSYGARNNTAKDILPGPTFMAQLIPQQRCSSFYSRCRPAAGGSLVTDVVGSQAPPRRAQVREARRRQPPEAPARCSRPRRALGRMVC
jgi:hypothetical protein